MLDFKALLKERGIPAAVAAFAMAPPKPPYVCILESRETDGADYKNQLANRDVTFELYHPKETDPAQNTIRKLLDEIGAHYAEETIYNSETRIYETVFEFEILEKLEGD